MDFIPAGYITIPTAVDRILRARHGEDWGSRELALEDGSVDDIKICDIGGNIVTAQHYDRQAIALARQQTRAAGEELRLALSAGTLAAVVDEGPEVPREYWQTGGADVTTHTGILELGAAAQPEDLKWQHCRVLLKEDSLVAWLVPEAPEVRDPQPIRRHTKEADVRLANRIKIVLSVAKRRWQDQTNRPGRNEMARLLGEDKAVRATGYKSQTIRKILDGTYSASRRLDIPGIAGIDPRVP